MSEKKSFYITTTLPYVNADPHIGFALEVLQADVLARNWRSAGHEVFFNTGTDEHGQKVFESAEREGRNVQEYTDHFAHEFEKLRDALSLSYDAFIRTTSEGHIQAAQEMWRRCEKDIYKKEFEGLYCVGCERYLTQKDLTGGKCSIHQTEPKLLKEENWFFNFKKYEKPLLEYLENPNVIVPDWRKEEAINFVKEGLEDFSISRDKSRLSWGVPVPGDETQVMYVWFDALTNYISTLGWPQEDGNFDKFWTQGHTVQMAGKDQIRFQSLMWQAMLMSARVKNTDQVFYHGFVISGDQKMSKSLGNVISPYDLVEKYGTDATRYLVLRHFHPTEDTDVTWEKLDEWYTAHLANGLGNLVSRIMKMAVDNLPNPVDVAGKMINLSVAEALDRFDFQKASDSIWREVGELDSYIQTEKPFQTIKEDVEVGREQIQFLVGKLAGIAVSLAPIMPTTSEQILTSIKNNEKPQNLFPRLN